MATETGLSPSTFKMYSGTGAGAAAEITVTGLGLNDNVLATIAIPADGSATLDCTANTSIFAADKIKIATQVTTSHKILLFVMKGDKVV